MDISVKEKFGNRLRIRVCGVCLRDGGILMVNHAGLREGSFWAPPGGGMEVGMSAAANLEREFREETGLEVKTQRWLFTTEFINEPLHAIEFFFEVTVAGGKLRTGYDPEMGSGQLIREVRFMPFDEVDRLPVEARHGAFRLVPGARNITTLNGYHLI